MRQSQQLDTPRIPQPYAPTMSRNYPIARNIEYLPCELIEEVIKEADFENVIRLSSWAEPQLKACSDD